MSPRLPAHRSERIEDWFSTGQDFEETLASAIRQCTETNTSALDLLIDISDNWQRRGMNAYMSKRQFKWLNNLAGGA